MSKRVKDHYEDPDDFEELLNQAQSQASTQWEMQFCADLVSKWDEHGEEMYLSDDQLTKLKDIANE